VESESIIGRKHLTIDDSRGERNCWTPSGGIRVGDKVHIAGGLIHQIILWGGEDNQLTTVHLVRQTTAP